MKNLRSKLVLSTLFVFTIVLGALQISSDTAHACYEDPITGLQYGFGCDGETILFPDWFGDWLKDRWEEIGEAPESAIRICRQVGLDKCRDPNFIQTYQLMRLGQWSKMYNDVNGCAATGFTFSEGGHQAVQYIALAKGVLLPGKFMEMSKSIVDGHIVASCQVLFGQTYNSNRIAYVGEGVYGKTEDAPAIQREINEQAERETLKTRTPTGGSSTSSSTNTTLTNSGQQIYFRNNCSAPVKLSLRYKQLNGKWITRGWWRFDGNGRSFLASGDERIRSNNSWFYYYATSTDGSNWVWRGTEYKYLGSQKLDMRLIQLKPDSNGNFALSISCS